MIGQHIFVITLVLLYINTASSSPLCLEQDDGMLLARNNSCNYYYICDRGFAILKKCSPGTFYDDINKVCANDTQSTCNESVQCTIWDETPPTEICNEYQYCDGTSWQLMQCKRDEFYDTVSHDCVPHLHARNDCDRCAVLDDERVYAYSNVSCNKYLLCSKGRTWFYGGCPRGQFYNLSTAECFPGPAPIFGSCNPSYWDPNAKPSVNRKCNKIGDTTPAEACNQYLLCDGKNWKLKQCNGVQFFDTASRKCVHFLHARNNCDRCAVIPDAVMYAHSYVGCNSYIKCVNGKISMSGVCAKGQFYNLTTGECFSGPQPNFGSCSSSYYERNTNPSVNEKCEEIMDTRPSEACDQYLYCNGMNWEMRKCNAGEFYDIIYQNCVNRFHARNNCDRCVNTPNGTYEYAFSNVSCNEYLVCESGKTVERKICPDGSYYDMRKGKCSFGYDPIFGCCNPEFWNSIGTRAPLINGFCATDGETSPAEACNQYLSCDDNQWNLKNCDHSRFYDIVTHKCVHRRHARNNCDRCIGITDGFVYAYSNVSCNKLLECKSGKTVMTHICPDGSLFPKRYTMCANAPEPNVGSCNPGYFAAKRKIATTGPSFDYESDDS